MTIWAFLKGVVATLTIVFLGEVLINLTMDKCMEVVEARLDRAVTLLEDTHTLRDTAEGLARGPVSWIQRGLSHLPFPLSFGVPAFVHHSVACPLPELSSCMPLSYFLRRLHVLEEYKACLWRYVEETKEGRWVLYFAMRVFRVVAMVVVAVALVAILWVFFHVLRAVSEFPVDSRGSSVGPRDILTALRQKLTPLTKKGRAIPPFSPSSVSSSLAPVTRWRSISSETYPESSSSSSSYHSVFPHWPDFSFSKTSPKFPSSSSSSTFTAFARTPVAHTPEVPQRNTLRKRAVNWARVQVFRVLLILGCEFLS